MTVTDEQLEAFCTAATDKARPHRGHALTLEYQRGKKYARIVERDGSAHGAVFCFVDLDSGAILKAAGWKTPAPQIRGNIANGAADVTPYGAAYLRR